MKSAIVRCLAVALLPLALFTLLYWVSASVDGQSAKMAAEGTPFDWYVIGLVTLWPLWLIWFALTAAIFAALHFVRRRSFE